MCGEGSLQLMLTCFVQNNQWKHKAKALKNMFQTQTVSSTWIRSRWKLPKIYSLHRPSMAPFSFPEGFTIYPALICKTFQFPNPKWQMRDPLFKKPCHFPFHSSSGEALNKMFRCAWIWYSPCMFLANIKGERKILFQNKLTTAIYLKQNSVIDPDALYHWRLLSWITSLVTTDGSVSEVLIVLSLNYRVKYVWYLPFS